jgi:hypothetical protein
MWFDAKAALAGMAGDDAPPVAPSHGANRAICANPPPADPPRLARLARLARPQPPAPQDDAATLAEALHHLGPMTQGVAASALGWGATRAWQAEARLRAAGAVRMDAWGRAVVEDANTEKCDIIASFSSGDPADGDGGPD